MDKKEFKEKLETNGIRYAEKVAELEARGCKKYVDWEIIRKLRVYLFNKGLHADFTIIEYRGNYTCILLDNHEPKVGTERGRTISVAVITPEDTEGSAYGKVDRIMIAEHKKYLEKGEK